MSKKNVFLFFLLIVFKSNAQLSFERYDSIPVEIGGNDILLAWAGGLNFVQTSNIDLDFDGKKDLFVFDRTGNKIKTFINKASPGTIYYKYEPKFESNFPALHDWVLLIDYNCDGKEDIFTYSDNGAGFAVYKNISTVSLGLQFTLVSPLVFTDYVPPNGGQFILYVGSASLPAITDVDNDGDLDVLTYGIGGNTIEYHINKSKELYGHCDSLIYELRNNCWGYTYEDLLSFQFTLNDTCTGNVPNPEIAQNSLDGKSEKKHSNSCNLCIDLNGDNVKDYVVSNISHNNIVSLINGGTTTASHFTSVDYGFPNATGGSNAVVQSVFPCAYYTDINNDGKGDLVVSPSAPGASENFESVIYYENIGTNSFPSFQYQQSNLLQDEMIEVGEGAYPAFFDYDNDGLKDLFIGNNGYYDTVNFKHQIAYFKNVGTINAPKFLLITRDFVGLSSLGLSNMIPTFGDMDGDGDGDMIIGSHDGKLHYFENTASIGNPANFTLAQANFQNSNGRVIDVGDYAAPQIFDVNGDNLNDLIIGGRNGKISYYQRISTTGLPQMDSITNFFGDVNVTLPNNVLGYSFPNLYKNGTTTEMIVGTFNGYLSVFNNIDGNLNGAFNLIDSTFMNVYEGARTAPCVVDINNDSLQDLFIGNYAGGLSFYKGKNSLTNIHLTNDLSWDFEMFPNPAKDIVTLNIYSKNKEEYILEIYNSIGQLIENNTILGTSELIRTDKLKAGLYIFKVSAKKTNQFSKPIFKKLLVIK